MNYRTLRLKIITGYAILAIVLVFAAQMVYDSTRSLTALNTASERLMERRNVVDSLVYSMLDAANAERSVMMGDTRQWQRFSTSLSESQRKAMQLKQLVSDSVKAMRMDTLANLLAAKRDNAMMVLFAMATARLATLLFHASTVSLEGKAYMFLGKSGTGKSTHSRLWLQNIEGAELVNDDNPVVRVNEDGTAVVYGSPWSGKTPCYRRVAYRLGGIVGLAQAPRNAIRRMGGIEAYALLSSSVSGKVWDKGIADGLHHTLNALAMKTAVWHLDCLPDGEAARLCCEAVKDK